MTADLTGLGGDPGFGERQWQALGVGLGSVTLGLVLFTGRAQRFLARTWRNYIEVIGEPVPGRRVLLVAVWLSLIAGLLDPALAYLQNALGHRFDAISPYIFWLAPASYFSLLLIPSLILALAAALGRKHLGTLPVAVFLLGSICALSLATRYHPEIHYLAITILAGGLGVRMALEAGRREIAFIRLLRRTTVPLLLVVIIAGSVIPVSRHVGERRAMDKFGSAPYGSPNLLLIILDTVRAANLSLYGYERPTTPNLERLAEEGVTFDRAYVPSSWTLPAHASIFTGRFPHELTADWQTPLSTRYLTLAARLRGQGFQTAAFVANRKYAGHHTGLQRGFLHYDVHTVDAAEILSSSSLGGLLTEKNVVPGIADYGDVPGEKRASQVIEEFREWRSEGRDGRRPFFVFLNIFDAHGPYRPPEPYDEAFRSEPPERPLDASTSAQSEADLKQSINYYDGSLAFVDFHIGKLIEELSAERVLDETVVIVMADHGEEFAEHGVLQHGRSLYLPLLHVPLVIRFPRTVPGGLRLHRPVSLRAVPQTALDLMGLGPEPSFRGPSLVPLWEQERPPTSAVRSGLQEDADELILAELTGRSQLLDRAPASRGDMVSLISGRHHYIVNGDGEEELYDIVEDPWEQRDLSDASSSESQLERFRALLASVWDKRDSARSQLRNSDHR